MAEVGQPPPATTRIHRALSRPNLLFGADRELVLLTGLAAVILIFVVLTPYSALLGIAIWIVVVGAAAHDGEGRSADAPASICATSDTGRYYRPTSTPWRRF